MDTSTGQIHQIPFESNEAQAKFMEALNAQSEGEVIPMKIEPTFAQLSRKPYARVRPNEPCGCGSGRKFKRCCLLGGNRHRGEK